MGGAMSASVTMAKTRDLEKHRAYNRARMARLRERDKNYSRTKDDPTGQRRVEARLRGTNPDALVSWANPVIVANIYARAKELRARGEDVQVDHIVPIQSDEVCGLHWEGNLQLMMGINNKRKGNSFETDDNTDMCPF